MKIKIDLKWWKDFKKKLKGYFNTVEVSGGRKKRYYKVKRYLGKNKHINFILDYPVSAIRALIPHFITLLVGSTLSNEVGKVLSKEGMWNPAPLMEVAIIIVTITGFIMSLNKKMEEDGY